MPVDLDVFPTIEVIEPSGTVGLTPTSKGVFRIGPGEYGYVWPVGLAPDLGVWIDRWQGTLGGFTVTGEFNFVVGTTQMPAINTDGYVHLGDDPGFNYSQNATKNVNSIMKSVRARLKSMGKHKTTNCNGNVVYTDCDIFSVDQLATFIATSLTMFNEIPTFTFFTFEDNPVIENFHGILTSGAVVLALSSQALIEKGQEFTITDNSISFNPPSVADLLNSQYTTDLANWMERVKLIKFNMKPNPLGLGTLRTLAASPQFMRLRFLRARRIIGPC